MQKWKYKMDKGVLIMYKDIARKLSYITQMCDRGDAKLETHTDSNNNFSTIISPTLDSICIMPYMLGKYFSLFYDFVSFYWREEDLPERVGRYFLETVFKKEITDESLNITSQAILFSIYIKQNKEIVGRMLKCR